MVGQLCLLDWECLFGEENTLEELGLPHWYLHSYLMEVVSGVSRITLEERNRTKEQDIYRETSFNLRKIFLLTVRAQYRWSWRLYQIMSLPLPDFDRYHH